MNQQQQFQQYNLFTHKNFAFLLSKYKYKLNIGDITAGTIFSQEKKGFLVDIGESIAAYLPIDEISIKKSNIGKPTVNNSREFFILAYNKTTKQLIISIKRLEYIRGWQRIKQLKNEDITRSLHIEKINRGGLITRLEGIQGFIPNSHITNLKSKSLFIKAKLKCKILFINEKTNTLILSNKRAILRDLIPSIYIGQLVNGTITKIKNYGIFININGFNALLHISEIDQDNLNNLKLFQIGNTIKVKIIHIDTEQGRLSVSRRNINDII